MNQGQALQDGAYYTSSVGGYTKKDGVESNLFGFPLIRNMLSTLKRPPAFSVHYVSKHTVLSIFSQGVYIRLFRV